MSSQQDKNIFYRVSGSGRPVVFLHGFLESETMWDYLDFGGSIKQIAIDLPGHGRSATAELESMESMAKHVIRTLDELNVEVYDVVGHSMGGYVGLELLRMDARCEKLVLLNSNFWADDAQKRRDRERIAKIVQTNKELFVYEAIPNLFLDPVKNTHQVQELIKEAVGMSGEAIAKASIAMSKRTHHEDLVRENASRVLIIQGVGDAIVPVERMRELQKSVATHYIELLDCGHMGHIEQPVSVIKSIREFIA